MNLEDDRLSVTLTFYSSFRHLAMENSLVAMESLKARPKTVVRWLQKNLMSST
jgi:hypothetical protein